MTKTHWQEILQDLVEIRKHDTTPIFYNDLEVDKIDIERLEIRFVGRIWITYDDIFRATPASVRDKFKWTVPVFLDKNQKHIHMGVCNV